MSEKPEVALSLAEVVADRWKCLNQAELTSAPEHFRDSLAFSDCLQYLKQQSGPKTLSVRALSSEDEAYLSENGISRAFLARNLDKKILGKHFHPRGFQLTAVRRGVMQAVSPFTGKSIDSHDSLLASLNVVFYRFVDGQVFYVACAGIGSGFPKCAVYFPALELVVTSGLPWAFEQEDLLELKARMISNAELCWEYLSDRKTPRKLAVCLGFYHFAHHLWNELSGIYRLYQHGLLSRVDKYFVIREPLGKLDELFPEIGSQQIERKETTGELFQALLLNRYLVIKVGDAFLPGKLAHRAYRLAMDRSSAHTLRAVSEARSQCSPLLWVGIRVGNRSWVNQVEGLSRLIDSLSEEFPRLGVVFDGFSLPWDRVAQADGTSEYVGILRRENDVVAAIIERLAGDVRTRVFNVIGSSILDANVWAHAIDVYLSPYGSIQHKVGWLANKPGIIHTNNSLLRKPSKQVWIGIEKAITPTYVDRRAVEDVSLDAKEVLYKELRDRAEIGAGVEAGDRRAEAYSEFDNYTVDWSVLRSQLSELIKSQQGGNRISAREASDWALRKFARLLQRTVD